MNTSLVFARVGFFGSYWEVTVGDKTYTVKTQRDLVHVLTKGWVVEDKPQEKSTAAFTIETVQQFLDRGGKINVISPPPKTAAPKPAAVEVPKVAPSRITLDMLFGKPQPKA